MRRTIEDKSKYRMNTIVTCSFYPQRLDLSKINFALFKSVHIYIAEIEIKVSPFVHTDMYTYIPSALPNTTLRIENQEFQQLFLVTEKNRRIQKYFSYKYNTSSFHPQRLDLSRINIDPFKSAHIYIAETDRTNRHIQVHAHRHF